MSDDAESKSVSAIVRFSCLSNRLNTQKNVQNSAKFFETCYKAMSQPYIFKSYMQGKLCLTRKYLDFTFKIF